MYPLLDTIHSPKDLQALSDEHAERLAEEIRKFLIQIVSQTGGHLSANLGVVELTLALHREFSSPQDRIVFDVGHQAYVHKIITGRKDQFVHLRQENGLSGFPKGSESEHDAFDTGHASTSISAALGLAKARDLQGKKDHVVAVIGDGALTGGMVYEAMNQAGRDKTPMIVVLNDNEMAIGPNVGALARRLNALRTKKSYLNLKERILALLDHPDGNDRLYKFLRKTKRRIKYFLLAGVFFEELGFTYLGPVDGHNLVEVEKVLRQAKQLHEPVLVHVKTVKGRGFGPAEKDAATYHGVGKFDPDTGEVSKGCGESWAHAVGSQLEYFAKQDKKTVVITAAMPMSTGVQEYSKLYPKRFFDVGIAEEHAVTFAAGLAKGGMKPYFVVYSTFLQRAYDQMIHDVCMPKLPVTFLVDHTGVVGEDGETHQGIYDIAYLAHIPNMTVMSPSNRSELCKMMYFAAEYDGPIAIRYPKGNLPEDDKELGEIQLGKGCVVYHPEGAKTLILAQGVCRQMAEEAARELTARGIATAAADARFVAPLSEAWLDELAKNYDRIITVEDHIRTGGFGMIFKDRMDEKTKVKIMALPDRFIEQGSRDALLDRFGISVRGIIKTVENWNAEA